MTIAFASGRVSLGATPVRIVAARAGRTELRLIPNGAAAYYGPDNTVTTNTGYPVTGINVVKEGNLNVEGEVWAVGGSNLYYLEVYTS